MVHSVQIVDYTIRRRRDNPSNSLWETSSREPKELGAYDAELVRQHGVPTNPRNKFLNGRSRAFHDDRALDSVFYLWDDCTVLRQIASEWLGLPGAA